MNTKKLIRSWFRISLLNFLVAAILGALLRYAFVQEIPGVNFRPVMYAHAHVAMLGWLYLGLFSLLIAQYSIDRSQSFNQIFWGTQITVFGMMVTFPIFGFHLIPLIFLTGHILCSYWFIRHFLKDNSIREKRQFGPFTFIQASLFFMVLSSLALWVIIAIVVLGLEHKPIYYMMVQAFLHFQFNGWFVFAILGLFFQFLSDKGIQIPGKRLLQFFSLLFISCFLTYALAVTWASPKDFLFVLNSVGAGLQFVAVSVFIFMLFPCRVEILNVFGSDWSGRLFKLAIASFIAKILIQTAVIIPFLATVAYTVRNFVIGFIHLILLGFITSFIWAFAEKKSLLKTNHRFSRLGIGCFFVGFFLTEIILFGQGLLLWAELGFIPYYYQIIFTVSLLLPLGVLFLLIGNKNMGHPEFGIEPSSNPSLRDGGAKES